MTYGQSGASRLHRAQSITTSSVFADANKPMEAALLLKPIDKNYQKASCDPVHHIGIPISDTRIDANSLFSRVWSCLFPYHRYNRFPGRLRGILGVIPRTVTRTTLYRWASGFHPLSVDVCNSLITRLTFEADQRMKLVRELEHARDEQLRIEAARPTRRSRFKGRG